jgi:hypothetical protein
VSSKQSGLDDEHPNHFLNPQSAIRIPKFLFRHLIVDGLQGALEHGAVCRVSGGCELSHDARARESQGLKLGAAGALFD